MADKSKELDLMIDVIIPSGFVIALFLINGIVLFFIYHKRKTVSYDDDAFIQVTSASSSPPSSSSPSLSSETKARGGESACGRSSLENGDADGGIGRAAAIATTSAARRIKGSGGDGEGEVVSGTNDGPSTSNSGISFIRKFTITSSSTSTSITPLTTIQTAETEVNAIEMERL